MASVIGVTMKGMEDAELQSVALSMVTASILEDESAMLMMLNSLTDDDVRMLMMAFLGYATEQLRMVADRHEVDAIQMWRDVLLTHDPDA